MISWLCSASFALTSWLVPRRTTSNWETIFSHEVLRVPNAVKATCNELYSGRRKVISWFVIEPSKLTTIEWNGCTIIKNSCRLFHTRVLGIAQMKLSYVPCIVIFYCKLGWMIHVENGIETALARKCSLVEVVNYLSNSSRSLGSDSDKWKF